MGRVCSNKETHLGKKRPYIIYHISICIYTCADLCAHNHTDQQPSGWYKLKVGKGSGEHSQIIYKVHPRKMRKAFKHTLTKYSQLVHKTRTSILKVFTKQAQASPSPLPSPSNIPPTSQKAEKRRRIGEEKKRREP